MGYTHRRWSGRSVEYTKLHKLACVVVHPVLIDIYRSAAIDLADDMIHGVVCDESLREISIDGSASSSINRYA